MPRGYWRIVIATVGLGVALFAIWAGAERTAIWADSPSAYPQYQETADDAQKRLPLLTIPQAIKAAKEQQPCRNPKGYDASYLCGEWRAADAAERSARWAWWQMVFSAIGITGLGVTLWFNLQAWQQAKSAQADTETALLHAGTSAQAAADLVTHAENTAKRQLRAYVGLTEVHWNSKTGIISVKTKNYGHTPAQNIIIGYTVIIMPTNINAETRTIGIMDPGQQYTDIFDISPNTITDIEESLGCDGIIKILFNMCYEDSFARTWLRTADLVLSKKSFQDDALMYFHVVDGSSREVEVHHQCAD